MNTFILNIFLDCSDSIGCNENMNILMVSSETVPFSKSGGLADVIGALSEAISGCGHEVRVFMPMYSFIDEEDFSDELEFQVPMLGSTETVSTVETVVGSVRYIGLIHPYFTERKGIYGDTSFSPYDDNARRFMLFSQSVLPYLEASGWNADVIHCHDWTTGTIPYIVGRSGRKIPTLFTIHNLAYQGEFSKYDAILGGYEPSSRMFCGDVMQERFNMMKTGLQYADRITTVSQRYAEEICTREQGYGLEYLLSARKKDLSGIINGIDYDEWDSSKDEFFSTHFSPEDLSGKAELKAAIQKEFGLEVKPDVPLFAMISRLAEQKGFSELLSGSPCALENILTQNEVQFIIIGTGDERFTAKLKKIEQLNPNLSVRIVFSSRIAHIVEGGADFFLMPSRYEPCGLNQLYSLHYGTLPCARRTGGLADSIIDMEEDEENGTGFLFDEMSGKAIEECVSRAVEFYFKSKAELEDARKRGMKTDLTWSKSALSYIEIYNCLIQGGKNECY